MPSLAWLRNLHIFDARRSMLDIKLTQVTATEPEVVDIRYHQMNDQVREIAAFVVSLQGRLAATVDGQRYEVPVPEVLYIEAVDNRVFLYTAQHVFEIRQRLYELESQLSSRHFLRISKSTIVNLMKVEAIKPALNGRFLVRLRNGEDVIVSRKYVPALKAALEEGSIS